LCLGEDEHGITIRIPCSSKLFKIFLNFIYMEVDFQVIKRYLDSEGKQGDKEKIINWFASLEAEKDLRNKYRLYWNELGDKQEYDRQAASVVLGRVYHKIKLEESLSIKRNRPLSGIINIASKIAAVLFISLIVILYINRDYIIPAGGEEVFSEIYSLPGTRTMFYLPDGSTGWLNGDSRLEFPAEFRGKSRKVVLKGEAYFDVRTNSKKPFIVGGENFKVVAYGTEFNILAYPGDQIIEVTDASGIVKVSGIKDGIEKEYRMLDQDQMCIIDMVDCSCQVVSVNAEEVISWKDGKLVFTDELFKDVVKKLNRWYNVNIVIKDKSLETHRYMATFKDETLEEVLKLLKLSAPIDYKDLGRKRKDDGTFEKRKIVIYHKP
jgi:transmembrane sensor